MESSIHGMLPLQFSLFKLFIRRFTEGNLLEALWGDQLNPVKFDLANTPHVDSRGLHELAEEQVLRFEFVEHGGWVNNCLPVGVQLQRN